VCRLIKALVLVAVAAVIAAPPAGADPQPPFGHAGRWITDAQGRVVVFHGLNVVDKLPPYYPASLGFDARAVVFLKSNGFDVVRLGIIWKALEPQPGVYDDHYLAQIAATARLLAAHGVFPFIDFHQDMYNERFDGEGAPDWAVQDDGLPHQPDEGFPDNYFFMTSLWRAYDHFWNNDPGPGGIGLQDRYAAAWAHVAAYFRADPSVLGFDIFNEPFPGSQYASCANPEGCPAFDAQLTAFTKRVFGAIRTADHTRMLWYEPNAAFNFGANTHHGNPDDPNSGMDFHVYCIGGSIPGASSSSPGSAQGCSTAENLVFDQAEAQSQSTGGALLESEFGGTDDLGTLERLVDESDQHMVSWIEWAYWNRDPCCARPAEGVVYDMSKPPTGDNVKTAKLAVLARPYPQAVAGTPTSWNFDPATREFDLAYSTSAPGGARLAPGARTEVVAPGAQYPTGYSASATGARVVSAPGASVIELVNGPGIRSVELKVTPTAGGPGAPRRAAGRRRRVGRRGLGCGARARVVIRLPRRLGRVVRARVVVHGRARKTVRGHRIRRVVLRVPHPHRRTAFVVRLVLRTAGGRRVVLRRRFGPCGAPPGGTGRSPRPSPTARRRR